MDKLYQKNALMPGDEGFEYDVRVMMSVIQKDFDLENYEAEWDDDEDEEFF